ncbi:MAG: hypothetical protein WCR59_11410, partial [Planctomycetota bacterium]
VLAKAPVPAKAAQHKGPMSASLKAASRAARKVAHAVKKQAAAVAKAGIHDAANAALNAGMPVVDAESAAAWVSANAPVLSHLGRARAKNYHEKKSAAAKQARDAAAIASSSASSPLAIAAAGVASSSAQARYAAAIASSPAFSPLAIAAAGVASSSAQARDAAAIASSPASSPLAIAAAGVASSPALAAAGNVPIGGAAAQPPPPPSTMSKLWSFLGYKADDRVNHVAKVPVAGGGPCSPASRAAQYENQSFTCVGLGPQAILRCDACKEVIDATKKSSCQSHVECKSHISKLAAHKQLKEHHCNIQRMLADGVEQSEKHFTRRVAVTQAFMCSGIPLSALGIKVDGVDHRSPLRACLELNNEGLTTENKMRDYIPRVAELELKQLHAELELARQQSPDRVLYYSVTADGTTHCAEVRVLLCVCRAGIWGSPRVCDFNYVLLCVTCGRHMISFCVLS